VQTFAKAHPVRIRTPDLDNFLNVMGLPCPKTLTGEIFMNSLSTDMSEIVEKCHISQCEES